MELAGLAVAQAVALAFPPSSHPRVLVAAGPGNNGGDGLVAARHLSLFGYDVEVCYPVRSAREPHYARLLRQLEGFGVPVTSDAGALPNPSRRPSTSSSTPSSAFPSLRASTQAALRRARGGDDRGARLAPGRERRRALRAGASTTDLSSLPRRRISPAVLVSLTAPEARRGGAPAARGAGTLSAGGSFRQRWRPSTG